MGLKNDVFSQMRAKIFEFTALNILTSLTHTDMQHVLDKTIFVFILAVNKINNLKTINLKQDK